MDSDENSSWDYKPGKHAEPEHARSFSWTAAEYTEYQQGAVWYVLMLLLLLIVAAVIYLLTKDYFALGVTIIAGLIAIFYTHRKPRRVTYELTSTGLSIGRKKYTYNSFKSFSIYREGELSSVNFLPVKRLALPVAAYFEPHEEQKVMAIVGDHIPYEEHKLDSVDRLLRSLHL